MCHDNNSTFRGILGEIQSVILEDKQQLREKIYVWKDQTKHQPVWLHISQLN